MAVAWKTDKMCEDDIKRGGSEIGYEDERGMKLVQNRVRCEP
jgi:hypothetical protein